MINDAVYCDSCGWIMHVTEVNMSYYRYECICGNNYTSHDSNMFSRQDMGRQKYYQLALERGGAYLERFRAEEKERVKSLIAGVNFSDSEIACLSPFGDDLFKKAPAT